MDNSIKFVHLADLHLGGWREKSLTQLNLETFKLSVDRILEIKPEFVLFAGDIFNNAIPPLDLVEKVVNQLMKLKENNISVFVIGGSHDYSNSGKSFISLLDSAGVFNDVCKFKYLDNNEIELDITELKNVRICGVLGKKKGLDKNIYSNLNSKTLSKDKLNIFMFHCTLNDFKPDFMKAVNVEITKSYLPKGFDYYAGGHIHTHMVGDYSTGILTYPGPLFPNNFSELKREIPCFNVCTFNFETRKTTIKREFLKTYSKEFIKIEINKLTPIDAKDLISSKINSIEVKDKIILLDIKGIVEGKINEIKINEIINSCYEKGALVVLKNTYKLTSSQVILPEINSKLNSENIEEDIINQILEMKNEKELVKNLLALNLEKIEGEKISQYESRVYEAVSKSLNSLNS